MNFSGEISILWTSGKEAPYGCPAIALRRTQWVACLEGEAFVDVEYGSKVIVFDLSSVT